MLLFLPVADLCNGLSRTMWDHFKTKGKGAESLRSIWRLFGDLSI